MNEVLEIVLQYPNCAIMLNRKNYKTDSEGRLVVSVDELLDKDRGLAEFDVELSQWLSNQQKQLFYELFANSNRIGSTILQKVLGGLSKQVIDEVLAAGMKHGIIIKPDTQYKLKNPMMKTLLRETFALSPNKPQTRLQIEMNPDMIPFVSDDREPELRNVGKKPFKKRKS